MREEHKVLGNRRIFEHKKEEASEYIRILEKLRDLRNIIYIV
jgi:hypothetical protein